MEVHQKEDEMMRHLKSLLRGCDAAELLEVLTALGVDPETAKQRLEAAQQKTAAGRRREAAEERPGVDLIGDLFEKSETTYQERLEEAFSRLKGKLGVTEMREVEWLEAQALEEFPFQGYIRLTQNRGIKLEQLRRVFAFVEKSCSREKLPWRDRRGEPLQAENVNLYDFNAWTILPATARCDCSFVELLAWEAQKPHWFTSHVWAQPIANFCKCLNAHARVRLLDDPNYWVCAYANRQHALKDEIPSQGDIGECSFAQSIFVVEGIVMLLDDGNGRHLAFQRLWCVFEAYLALQKDSHRGRSRKLLDFAAFTGASACILTDGAPGTYVEEEHETRHLLQGLRELSFPVEILARSLDVKVQDATVKREEDRKRILNTITEQDLEAEVLQESPKYDEMNGELAVRFALAGWQACAGLGRLHSMKIPSICSQSQQTEMCFDLRSLPQAGDDTVEAVADSLPDHLEKLTIDCSGCKQLTSRGTSRLSQRLAVQSQLKEFTLTCRKCEQLMDADVASLVYKLPTSMTKLHVDLSGCSRLLGQCLLSIYSRVTPSVQHLSLDLQACDRIIHPHLAALQLPPHLLSLRLAFESGTHPTDSDLMILSQSFAWLTHLSLIFSGSQSVSDVGLAILAAALPDSLQSLCLEFRNCHFLTEAGCAVLFEALPQGMSDLTLAFSSDLRRSHMSSSALESLSLSLPSSTQRLRVDLAGSKVDDGGLISFSHCLRRLSALREFFIDVSDCDAVNGEGLIGITSSLPATLERLGLRAERNRRLTRQDLADLARQLSPRLEITFSLRECKKLDQPATDAARMGMAALQAWVQKEEASLPGKTSKALPAQGGEPVPEGTKAEVRSRAEDFKKQHCEQEVTSAGAELSLQELEEHVRRHARDEGTEDAVQEADRPLAQLQVSFPRTALEKIRPSTLRELCRELKCTPELGCLHMDWDSCRAMDDEALKVLADSLPKGLETLHLNFRNVRGISDEGLERLAQSIEHIRDHDDRKCLSELKLGFRGNKRLTDIGFQRMAKSLAGEGCCLNTLDLDLKDCVGLRNAGLYMLAEMLTKHLSKLHLDISGCEHVSDQGLLTLVTCSGNCQDLKLIADGCDLSSDAQEALRQDRQQPRRDSGQLMGLLQEQLHTPMPLQDWSSSQLRP
eukprot:TRINITY_DN11749_c0_g1_i4.p1 TRINITY_DN11749_c0_g1~~TRINITY_DN11749_c0_g1_i4.p1  ORF type:complete len:1144 (-),score=223.21 TRINITY_DN11749_c0_g1_i4:60-3491(-)